MSVESPPTLCDGLNTGTGSESPEDCTAQPWDSNFLRQSHIALADPEPPILLPPSLVLGWQASTSPGAFNASLKLLPTRPVGINFLTHFSGHGFWSASV